MILVFLFLFYVSLHFLLIILFLFAYYQSLHPFLYQFDFFLLFGIQVLFELYLIPDLHFL